MSWLGNAALRASGQLAPLTSEQRSNKYLPQSRMTTIRANGLDFEVECTGRDTDPAVLLIMGLGMQLTAWPDAMIATLRDYGLRVIRFDNRDSGLSSKIESAGRPSMTLLGLRKFLHLPIASAYSLEDMAADGVAILDELGVSTAHVVGVSMGGMIAQIIAARYPDRVQSLSSIMSSSGAAHLPQAKPAILRALMARPRDSRNFDALVNHYVELFRLIGSPGYPTSPEVSRAHLAVSLKRSYYPVGTARQMAAIVASGDRTAYLQQIRCPALVIHGTSDPLLPLEAGRDTSRKIAGSKLLLVPGMGHDLAPDLVPILCAALRDYVAPNAR